jgi:hypothetical protein
MSVLGLIMLAGCVGGAPLNAGVAGPTGRAGDAGKIHAITVRDVWKMDLQARSLKLVTQQIPLGSTARFDDNVRFEGYYDSGQNVTSVGVYGNVTTTTDYGVVHKNGFYVIWEQTGRITGDFPIAPWRLVDVEIMDQQY